MGGTSTKVENTAAIWHDGNGGREFKMETDEKGAFQGIWDDWQFAPSALPQALIDLLAVPRELSLIITQYAAPNFSWQEPVAHCDGEMKIVRFSAIKPLCEWPPRWRIQVPNGSCLATLRNPHVAERPLVAVLDLDRLAFNYDSNLVEFEIRVARDVLQGADSPFCLLAAVATPGHPIPGPASSLQDNNEDKSRSFFLPAVGARGKSDAPTAGAWLVAPLHDQSRIGDCVFGLTLFVNSSWDGAPPLIPIPTAKWPVKLDGILVKK